MTSADFISLDTHPLESRNYRDRCKQILDKTGVLRLEQFLTGSAVESVRREGESHAQLAYFTQADHNVYLMPQDLSFDASHARNRKVCSSKGCITTDQIPETSVLKSLYHDSLFKDFLCSVLDEDSLHEYADALSSINCLLYTSPSPRDRTRSRMPSSA